MNTSIKKPSEHSARELAAFEALVRSGGEVNPRGLSRRIKDAALLMILSEDDRSIIGVSALKHPDPGYRERAFACAGSELRPDDFNLELGWIFVAESHRGRGLSRELVGQLVARAETDRIYATTREDNTLMRRTNTLFGFRVEGRPYQSPNGNHSLVLSIRPS